MSELAQAALISGGIFFVVTARGYGRRTFDRRTLVLPLVMVAIFGWTYLKNAPIDSVNDWAVYGVAVAIGILFGGMATLVTRIETDERTGTTMTVTGPAFVAVWLLAVLIRLAFVWAVTDNPSARMHFGEFMIRHHLEMATIAPFFLLWALTMVLSRMVALKVRERVMIAQRRESNTVCADRPTNPVMS